jgi:transcriptional regulator with XRE-family HTH domain
MHARIKEARSRLHVSQEEFALRLKVSRGAVAQWEMADGTSPTVKNLEQIAKLSGLAFEWVATGRGPKVFGEPMVKDDAATYHSGLSEEEELVIKGMRKLTPARRAALVELIKP